MSPSHKFSPLHAGGIGKLLLMLLIFAVGGFVWAKAQAGTAVKLIHIDAKNLLADYIGGQAAIPIDKTDLRQRAETAMARVEAQATTPSPILASDTAVPAPAATPEYVAPGNPASQAPQPNASTAAVQPGDPFAQAALVHPGALHSLADLQRMKAKANVEPWKSSYAYLQTLPQAKVNYVIQGPFTVVGREPNIHLREYQSDCMAVYYQAIMWNMTGNSAYADKACQIINAWTTTHTSWSGGTPRLAGGYIIAYMAMGAEILRYTFPGWTPSLTSRTENYFNNVVFPVIGGASNGRMSNLSAANQGAIELRGAITMAIFNDDKNRFNNVLDAFLNDPCAGLQNSTLASGQYSDMGRDEGHAGEMIRNLFFVAEAAWVQHVDLFGSLNNRLLACAEYFSAYAWHKSVPFTTFGACYGIYTVLPQPAELPTERETGAEYFCEIARDAYVIRKRLLAPYTMRYLKVLAVHENVLLYRKDGDMSTASLVQPRSLMSAPPLATSLADANVGRPGMAGSASYSNGVWTLRGSGANIGRGADQFNFAYQRLSGDGSIIARVLTEGNTGANAKAGVMIRESLEANSTCATCDLTPDPAGGPEYLRRMTTGAAVLRFGYHRGHASPFWVKLERIGNRFTAYDSADGQTWTPNGTFEYSMGNTVYAGLIVCSMDRTKLCTATFDNVRIGSVGPRGRNL